MPMASSYVFPPPPGEGTTADRNGPYSHSPSNSFSGGPYSSSPKKSLSGNHQLRKESSSASLFTHLEASNESTPVVSPAHEYQRTLTTDLDTPAHHSNGLAPAPRLYSNAQSHHDHNHDHDHEHIHEHSHDHDHHAHNHLAPSMKSRPRGESDLSRPAGSNHPQIRASSSWFSLPEALTSLLIPLPYLLASAAYPNNLSLGNEDAPPLSTYERLRQSTLGDDAVSVHPINHHRGLIESFILTAGTLLLVGILAKTRSSGRTLDRRKDKVETPSAFGDIFTIASTQKMITRALSIGLPFYASTQIGGLRTGLILLVAIASGLANVDGSLKHSLSGLTGRIALRTGSVAVILLGLVLDFSGVTFKAAFSELLFGYLALACSILLISPPLPTSKGLTPPSQSSSVMTPTSSNASWSQAATSPLASSTSDINITLAAGVFMSICTILLSGVLGTAPPISQSTMIFSSLSLACAAAAILFGRPMALRSPYKAGVGFSCLLFATFSFLFSPSLWPGTIANGGLSAASFIAVLYDTTTIAAHDHHDAHTHEQAHTHTHKHDHHSDGKKSIVTKYLIDRCEPGSLLHGILSERDSRRIAYFTW